MNSVDWRCEFVPALFAGCSSYKKGIPVLLIARLPRLFSLASDQAFSFYRSSLSVSLIMQEWVKPIGGIQPRRRKQPLSLPLVVQGGFFVGGVTEFALNSLLRPPAPLAGKIRVGQISASTKRKQLLPSRKGAESRYFWWCIYYSTVRSHVFKWQWKRKWVALLFAFIFLSSLLCTLSFVCSSTDLRSLFFLYVPRASARPYDSPCETNKTKHVRTIRQ